MILKCPVCQLGLKKIEKSYQCSQHHNYDISKYGYTNLLLANQIHSDSPGDQAFMIQARNRFLSLDYYHFLRQEVADLFCQFLPFSTTLTFCDFACGEGYYTNYIHQILNQKKETQTFGIDLSKQAIIEACKRKKKERIESIEYVIGNLMNLPFLNESFDCALNCFAPMFEKEFYRVLKKDGIFIRVLPGKNHLFELKKIIYEKVEFNELKELNIEGFLLLKQKEMNQVIHLKSNQEIMDLFTMTPYYYKSPKEGHQKLKQINNLCLTASFVILVYQKA